MKKVITYGTFDLLHYGHIRLLERAKRLGDYLIVGVTSDDFDKSRGKINVNQSLSERIEAIRLTGLADEIIVEEYEGQKIDDVIRYEIDVFAIGSDWLGKFDYLKEYCEVCYLERTEGVSSTSLRSENRKTRFGVIGDVDIVRKFIEESKSVDGVVIASLCTKNPKIIKACTEDEVKNFSSFEEMADGVDAVYIASTQNNHYSQVKYCLDKGKHVICKAPIALSKSECEELFKIAREKNLVLVDDVKTAYFTAYERLVLLAKSGKIGKLVSIKSTCTSLSGVSVPDDNGEKWNSICAWGPIALLPVFQMLGCDYKSKVISSLLLNDDYDEYTKIDFVFEEAVATVEVGKGIKSEGQLIISGTDGYIFVPSPWWKTDYFEIRYENPQMNKRYYYQLDGEGLRYEIRNFMGLIENKGRSFLEEKISMAICKVVEDFYARKNFYRIG